MDKEKEIEELKLIIAKNMATYSKAKMPYEEALKMSALGILASGYGNIKQAVREFAEELKTYCETQFEMFDKLYDAVDNAELALQFIERRNEYHNMKLKMNQLLKEKFGKEGQ